MGKIKLKSVDKNYGCFEIKAICGNCQKQLFAKSFSWDRDKLTMTDNVAIKAIMAKTLTQAEYYFCPKCGTDLRVDKDGN